MTASGYKRPVDWSWLPALEVIYVVLLATWIVHEKRHPLATVAWILSLALLPVAGFAVYWMLGPRRLARKRSRRARALRRIRASLPAMRELLDRHRGISDEALDANERRVIALALHNSESPVSAGNAVAVLRDGAACYDALEAAVRAARHHIHFEYYIFQPDETGRRFRDLLAQKAREGVKVRMLVDAIGTLALGRGFLDPLLQAGGEFGVFNPVTLARFRPLNFRNHRKIVVIDGSVGFVGGLNVGDEYLGRGPAGAWRDTHLRIQGPSVQGLQLLFMEDWQFATGRAVGSSTYFDSGPPQADNALVQIIGSGPDQPWPAIQQVMFAAVSGSERRVSISTPYFVPDEATIAALTTAALRGVDVRLLLPSRSDAPLVQAAGRSYYDTLLSAGVRIHEYTAGFLHAKLLVVDGSFGMLGSANFDQRSFRLNLEAAALVYDNDVAQGLESLFDDDLAHAREITPAVLSSSGFFARMAEASARVLSPLL